MRISRAVPGGSGKGVGGKGGLFWWRRRGRVKLRLYSGSYHGALRRAPSGFRKGEFSDGIGFIWKDLSIYVDLEIGLGCFRGTTPQLVLPYLAENYPFNALAYSGHSLHSGVLGTISAVALRSAITTSRSTGLYLGAGSMGSTPTRRWSSRTS